MTSHTAQLMAQYNQWMNQRIYAICSQLSDEARKQDRGAFFKSMHGTLNHILLADKVWLGRFEGAPFSAKSLDQILYEDFEELRNERTRMDGKILSWTEQLTQQALDSTFRYTSMLAPAPRSAQLGALVTHFFNHQTHHRGQFTTLLSQAGIDMGVTDLIGMPGVLDSG